VDIRKLGSGNAGGTNAFRTQGLLFAVGVVIIDIGKGALAAGWLPLIHIPGLDPRDSVGLEVTAVTCGLAAILGHIYPIYHGFRGGKGVATYIGALAAILPLALVPAVGLWVLVIAATGYVGLASMVAVTSVIPLVWWLAPLVRMPPVVGFAALAAALIVFVHRSNVVAMMNGTEHRFEKARLVYWLGRR
jgi:glycerol-3-phosphate acyltransferase PlsY